MDSPSNPTRSTSGPPDSSGQNLIQPGMVLRDYEIVQRIGKGGMGEVFQARHQIMDRMVALKVVRTSALVSPQAVQRFEREIQALSELTHPNVVSAYDAGQEMGVLYLVMELMQGIDLHQWVAQRGPFPLPQALTLILQAADGLAFAHEKGIIHRDIKPANLFLTQQGQLRILDFGLATLKRSAREAQASREGHLTSPGALMGTIDFMAPEQAEDAANVDGRADVYSLGCTLFFLLSGKIPFQESTLPQRLIAHRETPVPPLVQLPHSEKVNSLIRWMMAKKPQDRPSSMRELIQKIQSWSAQPTPSATPMNSPTTADAVGAVDLPTITDDNVTTDYVASRRWMIWLAVPVVLMVVLLIWSPWSNSDPAKDKDGPTPGKTPVVKNPNGNGNGDKTKIVGSRLPADWNQRNRQQRVEWVKDELMRLNPGLPRKELNYNSKFDPTFTIGHDKLINIEPLRHLDFLADLLMEDSPELEDISVLKHLPLLEQLSLTRTAVKDISVLSNLKNLGVLYLRDCNGVKTLEPLRNLKHLGIVDCAGTSITSIEPLRGHPELYELDLVGSLVEDLRPVLSLPSLTDLECDPDLAEKFRRELQKHPNAKKLRVNNKRILQKSPSQ